MSVSEVGEQVTYTTLVHLLKQSTKSIMPCGAADVVCVCESKESKIQSK